MLLIEAMNIVALLSEVFCGGEAHVLKSISWQEIEAAQIIYLSISMHW